MKLKYALLSLLCASLPLGNVLADGKKAAAKPAAKAETVAEAKPADEAVSKDELRAMIRELIQEEIANLQPAAAPAEMKPASRAKPGETLAHTCAGCHGTNGTLANEAFMPLAGIPEQEFVQTMLDFRDGKRQSTLMGTVANGLDEQQIRDMAAFFAQVPIQTAEVSP